MKRSISFSSDPTNDVDNKMKKKICEDLVPKELELELETMSVVLSDDNLLYEILKHVDPSNNGATSSSPVASAWPCLPPPHSIASAKPATVKKRWGKDEVQLSLLSIKYYEKMNFSNRE
ncbi:hypothetical protein Tco_0853245 [Tanacetum coccineum]